MKVILLGYRASGKSTVAKLVSDQLQWPLWDIDRGIELKSGLTLTELYQQVGENRYRQVESEVVAEMCANDSCVIAFGAGTIMQPRNERLAEVDSLVVYLKLSAEQLWQRIAADPNSATTRPDLSSGGIEEVVEMLARRAPTYERCAAMTLDGQLAPVKLGDKIVERVNQLAGS
jgi:shikimate kinase